MAGLALAGRAAAAPAVRTPGPRGALAGPQRNTGSGLAPEAVGRHPFGGGPVADRRPLLAARDAHAQRPECRAAPALPRSVGLARRRHPARAGLAGARAVARPGAGRGGPGALGPAARQYRAQPPPGPPAAAPDHLRPPGPG